MASVFTASLVLATSAGCARAGGAPPPKEFRTACGHPGSTVVVDTVPVTVRHAACHLTGARIRYGLASVEVPARGSASGNVETFVYSPIPTQVTVTVDDRTGDVTVSSTYVTKK